MCVSDCAYCSLLRLFRNVFFLLLLLFFEVFLGIAEMGHIYTELFWKARRGMWLFLRFLFRAQKSLKYSVRVIV